METEHKLRRVTIRIEQHRADVTCTTTAEGMDKQRKEHVRKHPSMAAAMSGAAAMLLHGVTAGTQAEIQQASMVAATQGLSTAPAPAHDPTEPAAYVSPANNPLREPYKHSSEDIVLWPDDVWCYRYELSGFTHKSDDYLILADGSQAHADFLKSNA